MAGGEQIWTSYNQRLCIPSSFPVVFATLVGDTRTLIGNGYEDGNFLCPRERPVEWPAQGWTPKIRGPSYRCPIGPRPTIQVAQSMWLFCRPGDSVGTGEQGRGE